MENKYYIDITYTNNTKESFQLVDQGSCEFHITNTDFVEFVHNEGTLKVPIKDTLSLFLRVE